MGAPEETRPQGTTGLEEFESGRPRRFQVASQTLTRDLIADALDRPNVVRFAAIVHDKDPGVRTHSHVVLELNDGRTLQTVANMLRVPLVLVRSVVGKRGDTHSFARAVRYLTHESPTEQAKGKYRYPDAEVFASAGYEWRAEIDALSARGGFLPPLLERLKLQVFSGERSAHTVREEHPYLYLRHAAAFDSLEKRFMTEFATAAQREVRLEEMRRRAAARG
ncbi:Rep family protein [Cryobacterium sp. CG_9.6]|uniref:Rep family protein n=1 Tax=Cryobacterium sp. CG_9.6 TaxID=2760710 RepID=UPI002475F97C|nr:Rep family protein [Cryobacterium sp. CG_9.6]MDH6238198.1 hypothetical protein [Cryobacterium sp. CG_9.6]